MLGFFDKKKKILFVEDDEKILKMYQMYFENNKNYNAYFASNREQFVKHIDNVDVVVSDYHVPSLRFEEVKKRCEMNKIPLILISGDIKPYHKSQLSKPVQLKTILVMVEKELNKNDLVKKAS